MINTLFGDYWIQVCNKCGSDLSKASGIGKFKSCTKCDALTSDWKWKKVRPAPIV